MRPKGFSQCQRQRLDANPDDVLKHRVTGLPGPGAKRRVVFCHPKGDEAAVPARLLPAGALAQRESVPFMGKVAGSIPACFTKQKSGTPQNESDLIRQPIFGNADPRSSQGRVG